MGMLPYYDGMSWHAWYVSLHVNICMHHINFFFLYTHRDNIIIIIIVIIMHHHASFMHLISAFMLCYIQHSSFVVLENRILLLLLVTEVLLSTDFNASSSVVDKIESIVFVAVDVVTVDDDTCGS